MQLAAAGWRVTAVDQSSKRLGRLAANLARTDLAAETLAADIRHWEPAAPVDAILLDAPCSATGIFRRHPDVLHRIGSRQIEERAELRSEEHTSELQSLMRISYAVFCLKKKNKK